MILLAVALAWAATLLAVARPREQDLSGRLQGPAGGSTAGANHPGRSAGPVVGGVVVVVVVLLVPAAGLLAGSRGTVLVGCLAAVAATAVRWWRSHRRTRLVAARRVEVARACSVLASHLRVGQIPSDALAAASVDCPVLMEAVRTQDIGGDVVELWRQQARQPGRSGLLDLARSWRVAVDSGAPLAPVLSVAAESLRSDQVLQGVVAGELAAPRATAKVMAVLPALGVAMGYLLGGSPLTWLWAEPLGWACLSGGVLLACAGVLWIEALAERASVTRAGG